MNSNIYKIEINNSFFTYSPPSRHQLVPQRQRQYLFLEIEE